MTGLIEKIKQHCIELLSNSSDRILPYHNLQHTLEVLNNVEIICDYENSSDEDLEILQIAALFHDKGILQRCSGHEKISATNAELFLKTLMYPKHKIKQVIDCIMATKMPQNPKSKLERILCDADLFHLTSPQYFIKNELLRIEWEINLNMVYTDEEWQKLNFKFLKDHHYFTSYGQSVLEVKKNNNRYLLQQRLS